MDRRTFLRRASMATAAGLGGCSSGSDGTATVSPSTPDIPETDLPSLSTDGRWVVDEDRNEVVLRGLATVEPWWAQEYTDQRGGDYWTSLELLTDESEAWYPSVVRIPCTVNWRKVGIETYADRFLDRIVAHCAEQGVYVILDHHLIRPYDTEETDEIMRTFWNAIAPRYADSPHVVYELFNEPTAPHVWDDDVAAWNTWKQYADPWIDAVRDHAPETPLIVGSPRWTSLTHMATEDPFEQDDLIYSGHVYPADGQPSEFDSTYGAPAEDVPVMITEFGWDLTGDPDVDRGTTSGWGKPFREWIESYPNVGWQGWCFDPVWEPALLDTDWNLLGGDAYAGHFLKRWLYEKRGNRVPDAVPTSGASYSGPSDSTPPPVPTGVTAKSAGRKTYWVSWDAVEDGETSTMFYVVYANGSLAAAIEDGTSTTLHGTPGETHEVTVSAVDAVGNESGQSGTKTIDLWGELAIHAEIPRVTGAPTIDASVEGVWSNAAARTFQHVIRGSVDDDADLGGSWRALWDDRALYVLVDVLDGSYAADSDSQYQDDSVEIYVDADNSKSSSYDGENDFQFSFPRRGDAIGGRFPSGADPDAVEWARAPTEGGYRVEAAVPWSLLGVSPDAGHTVGFDVHLNDDDDGGDRDGKVSWFAEEDDSWQNPSLFANAKLVE